MKQSQIYGQNVQLTAEELCYSVGEQLAHRLGTKDDSDIRLTPVTSGVLQGSTLSPVIFNISTNNPDTGLEGIISWLRTLNWEELLTLSRAEKPCRKTSTHQRDWQFLSMRSLSREVPDSVPRMGHPGWVDGEQLWEPGWGPGCPGPWPVGAESAVSWSQEGHSCPGEHQGHHRQQGQRHLEWDSSGHHSLGKS